MKKVELVKIVQAARTYYEDSRRWFGYSEDAEDRGDMEFAQAAANISLEYENKMRGLLYAIEITTGYELGLWCFGEWTNEAIAEIIIEYQKA